MQSWPEKASAGLGLRYGGVAAGKAGSLPVIDLHGQHVNEALRIVERELTQRRVQKTGTGRSTQILVGTQHHSKVQSSMLSVLTSLTRLICWGQSSSRKGWLKVHQQCYDPP